MDLSTKLSGQKLNLEQILVTKSVLYLFFFLNKKKMVTLIAFYICVRMAVMSIIKRKEKENGSNVFLILKYKMTSLSLSLSLTNYLLCFV